MITAVAIAAFVAKLKAAAISALAGYAMRYVLGKVKVGVPKLWEYVPEALRPYASTILGTIAGIVAGDPTQIVMDAAAGAAGGYGGKVVHDGEKKAAENAAPCPPPMFGGGAS